MTYDFNAGEIFDVAIRIEENGAAFYRKAAKLQKDSKNEEFLTMLGSMEDRHKVVFVEMKEQITEMESNQTVFDPDNESSQYLLAMADSHSGEGSPAVADRLTGRETIAEILTIARDLEKESILFYVGLRDFVPPKYGQDKIDDIISEERKHVILLDTFLKKAHD